MSIIVDAYNYIGRSRELKLDDSKASDKIIYLMGQYCGRIKKKLTLVFDGNFFPHLVNRKRQYGRVTVIYTSPIYTADHAIKKMLKNQQSRLRKSLLVVTSDEEILDYARSHGTQVSKSEDFERQIEKTLAQKKGLDRVNIRITEQEVQEWLAIFGLEEHDEETPAPRKYAPVLQQPQKAIHNVPRTGQDKKKKRKQKRTSSSQTEPSVDRVNVRLSSQEVGEWMKIFGTEDEDE